MAKKDTVESRVAQTILQESKIIEAGGKKYEVAPPSTATLIKVSELVSQMPEIDIDTDRPVSEALRVAKDCSVITDIIATAILGVKRINKNHKYFLKSLFKRNELKKLSAYLAQEKTPKELYEMFVDLFMNRMDVGFFLQISTSLSAVNMTKRTKETIASGQQ